MGRECHERFAMDLDVSGDRISIHEQWVLAEQFMILAEDIDSQSVVRRFEVGKDREAFFLASMHERLPERDSSFNERRDRSDERPIFKKKLTVTSVSPQMNEIRVCRFNDEVATIDAGRLSKCVGAFFIASPVFIVDDAALLKIPGQSFDLVGLCQDRVEHSSRLSKSVDISNVSHFTFLSVLLFA
jgi:hypothetical protein